MEPWHIAHLKYLRKHPEGKKAELDGGKLPDTDFSGYNLSEAIFDGEFTNRHWKSAQLSDAQFKLTSMIYKSSFKSCNLSLLGFFGYMESSKVHNCNFEQGAVVMATINNTQWSLVSLQNSFFRDSKILDCIFANCNFQKASLQNCDFSGCVFDGCNLTGVDLTTIKLKGASFRSCKMEGVKVFSENLIEAELSNQNLQGVTLDGFQL